MELRNFCQNHHSQNTPTEEFFNKNCITLEEEAGSVFYFNARLWHRGGIILLCGDMLLLSISADRG